MIRPRHELNGSHSPMVREFRRMADPVTGR